MIKLLSMCAFAMAAQMSFAQAGWMYNSSGGEFDGDALQYAFVGSGSYGFGVRCQSKQAEAIFVTRDTSFNDSDALATINLTKPQLKYKVDGGQIYEISGELNNGDTGLAFIGDVTAEDMGRIRDAKKSLAVVINVMGKNYHETKFPMAGSSNAVGKVMDGCAAK